MEKQSPEKKQRGRTNAFRILAGGYLLYLAYQLIAGIQESDHKALSIGAAVVFIAVGCGLLWREWKAYRYGLEHKDDPSSWSDEPEELAETAGEGEEAGDESEEPGGEEEGL